MIWEMENVLSEFSAKQWLLLTKEGHRTIYAFFCEKHKVKWLNWRFCRELNINIICPCLYSQWAATGKRGRSCWSAPIWNLSFNWIFLGGLHLYCFRERFHCLRPSQFTLQLVLLGLKNGAYCPVWFVLWVPLAKLLFIIHPASNQLVNKRIARSISMANSSPTWLPWGYVYEWL